MNSKSKNYPIIKVDDTSDSEKFNCSTVYSINNFNNSNNNHNTNTSMKSSSSFSSLSQPASVSSYISHSVSSTLRNNNSNNIGNNVNSISNNKSSSIINNNSSSSNINNSNNNINNITNTSNYAISKQGSSSNLLSLPGVNSRKLSLPVIIPRISPSHYLEEMTAANASENLNGTPQFFDAGRKRLSAVGVAVSQHLQTTIGWKKTPVHEEIVHRAKSLCIIYFRFKLRKCGLMHKKLAFQRLKSFGTIDVDNRITHIAFELKLIIEELERRYPKLYESVSRNIGNSVAIFSSYVNVENILHTIAREIFRNDITWTRVAAYYAIAGAFAVDCVKAGHPDYVMNLIGSFTDFFDRDLATWVAQQGDWESLLHEFRNDEEWRRSMKITVIFISITLLMAMLLMKTLFSN